jgi:hypothetical protein
MNRENLKTAACIIVSVAATVLFIILLQPLLSFMGMMAR